MEDLRASILKLQNVMKKDPESYYADFKNNLMRFRTLYEMQIRKPDFRNNEFLILMSFIGSVIPKYPAHITEYFQILFNIISHYAESIETKTRFETCLMLFKLRKYNLVSLHDFIDKLISLFACKDKTLRSDLLKIIVKDIKTGFKKGHFDQIARNKLINSFFDRITNPESHKNVQYACLCILLELWRRNVLRDDKTANSISLACFSRFHKVSFLALISLKGKIFKCKEFNSIEKNLEDLEGKNLELKKGSKVHRTAKTLKKMGKKMKSMKKIIKIKENEDGGQDFKNTSLIRLIYSPEKFSERLFSLLKSQNKFEYRVLVLEVLARVISVHELIMPNFYQYCLKYIKPHQENVIKVLTALAQASHSLVPQEFIQPVIESVCNNFISLQVASEICSVGINSVREIYSRAPHTADSIIVNDLVQYAHDRKADRSVVSAARSLLAVLRTLNPEILLKKYREFKKDSKDESFTDDSDFESINSDEEFEEEEMDENSRQEGSESEESNGEITNIEKIATVYGLKKSKANKEVAANKVNPYKGWRANSKASTTNKEKKKNKSFFMAKNKVEVKKKKSRSFKQRAASIKKSLLKQQKAKKKH